MRNQFFYTETITSNDEEGNPVVSQKRNSFNLDLVIRTITLDDDGLLVLLNDLHERTDTIPQRNKSGKVSFIKERNTFQSEIRLSKDDSDRFYNLTNIE